HRTIVAVARRFLSAPDDLDRAPPQLLGNRNCLAHVILIAAPSEPAAQKAVMEVNLFKGNTGYFRCIDCGILRILGPCPNPTATPVSISSPLNSTTECTPGRFLATSAL